MACSDVTVSPGTSTKPCDKGDRYKASVSERYLGCPDPYYWTQGTDLFGDGDCVCKGKPATPEGTNWGQLAGLAILGGLAIYAISTLSKSKGK